MRKKLSYRKAKKGIAQQYNVNISMDIIKKMRITEKNREVDISYDARTERLIIRKIDKKD